MQVEDYSSLSEIFSSSLGSISVLTIFFEIKLIYFGLSQLELTYFLLGLGWTSFRPDLIGSEICDNENTTNGDGEDGYKKVNEYRL